MESQRGRPQSLDREPSNSSRPTSPSAAMVRDTATKGAYRFLPMTFDFIVPSAIPYTVCLAWFYWALPRPSLSLAWTAMNGPGGFRVSSISPAAGNNFLTPIWWLIEYVSYDYMASPHV